MSDLPESVQWAIPNESKGPFTNTCWGALCKKGALKMLTLVRGALKKLLQNFQKKNEFTCSSMGLSHNFHGKKGALKFFEVWRGSLKIFWDIYLFIFFFFFCIRPPYKCLWTVPNTPWVKSLWWIFQSRIKRNWKVWHFLLSFFIHKTCLWYIIIQFKVHLQRHITETKYLQHINMPEV